jgi:hypothetical protein
VEAAPAEDPTNLLDWVNRNSAGPTAPTWVDPSAETIAEEKLPLPPAMIVPDRTTEPSARDRPAAASQRRSLLLIGLISYASAATLALIYLLFAISRSRPHALESLPDVPPLDVEHGEVMKLAPADADLPPGHRLELGESRRFGNILVEPVRVVREPIAFEHFSGQTSVSKPPTRPVLKLWLRFTNVSDNQTIAPLDPNLVFRRAMLDSGPQANQIIRNVADQKGDVAQVLLYDHPISSEWDLSDQQLGVPLAPGESLETFLPSEEAGADLTGLLVWRVHFRKGYSPRGYGVTTLVDVEFDAPTVQQPAPAAAG